MLCKACSPKLVVRPADRDMVYGDVLVSSANITEVSFKEKKRRLVNAWVEGKTKITWGPYDLTMEGEGRVHIRFVIGP